MNNADFGKTIENTEISTLQQLEQEGIIQYQNQTILQQLFFLKGNRNKEKSSTYEYECLFRTLNTITK